MAEVDYDERTALIVTDVQNDFADPAGSLYVRGGDRILPFVNGEIGRAIQAGAYVVYTQDWQPESTPHFQKNGGIWPVHCVKGSWGAAFQDGLSMRGEVIRKEPVARMGTAASPCEIRHPANRRAPGSSSSSANTASNAWSSSDWPPTTA